MIRAVLSLLACQLAGTLISQALSLPVPGAVLGMAGLFALLARRGGAGQALDTTAQTLLRHLGLLFVPAGVGIVTQLDRLRDHGAGLAVTLIVSTLAALLVSGWVLQRLLVAQAADEEGTS
jgi:putative effector of murein hydrolase LrgA (UPF0299 family)